MSTPNESLIGEWSPPDEFEEPGVRAPDLGAEADVFAPDVEIASWVEVVRLEAELEADWVGDLEGDPQLPAVAEFESSGGFVLSDSDVADEPAPRVSVAGATADPVKDYLQRIGRVALLSAEQEVALASQRVQRALLRGPAHRHHRRTVDLPPLGRLALSGLTGQHLHIDGSPDPCVGRLRVG